MTRALAAMAAILALLALPALAANVPLKNKFVGPIQSDVGLMCSNVSGTGVLWTMEPCTSDTDVVKDCTTGTLFDLKESSGDRYLVRCINSGNNATLSYAAAKYLLSDSTLLNAPGTTGTFQGIGLAGTTVIEAGSGSGNSLRNGDFESWQCASAGNVDYATDWSDRNRYSSAALDGCNTSGTCGGGTVCMDQGVSPIVHGGSFSERIFTIDTADSAYIESRGYGQPAYLNLSYGTTYNLSFWYWSDSVASAGCDNCKKAAWSVGELPVGSPSEDCTVSNPNCFGLADSNNDGTADSWSTALGSCTTRPYVLMTGDQVFHQVNTTFTTRAGSGMFPAIITFCTPGTGAQGGRWYLDDVVLGAGGPVDSNLTVRGLDASTWTVTPKATSSGDGVTVPEISGIYAVPKIAPSLVTGATSAVTNAYGLRAGVAYTAPAAGTSTVTTAYSGYFETPGVGTTKYALYAAGPTSIDPGGDGTASYKFIEDTCADNEVLTFKTASGGLVCQVVAPGGDSVTVNGSATTNPNFNDTTPAAPTSASVGGTNVKWQLSDPSVSAYVPEASLLLRDPSDAPGWSDGLFTSWTSATTTAINALDDINEALSALAPAQPLSMAAATLSFETCPSADTAPACAATSSRSSVHHATSGAGLFYKSAAGEAFSAYTGGGLVLADNFTLRPPEVAPTESGLTSSTADDAFSQGSEGTLSARIAKSGAADAQDGSISLASASPPVSNGAVTLNAKNVGYNSFPLWVRGDTTMDPDATTALGEGYNKLFFRHNVTSNRDSANFEVYVDTQGTNVTFTSPCDIDQTTPNGTKFISGVEMFNGSQTFCISADLLNLFSNSYQDSAFTYAPQSGNWFSSPGTATVEPTPEASWNSTVSDPPTLTDTTVLSGGANCSGASKETFVALANMAEADARVTCTAQKPLRSAVTSTTASELRMVHSWAAIVSLAGSEPMLDEDRRQLASFDSDSTSQALTGNWTSTADLLAADAQVWMNQANDQGALLYPTLDFTLRQPSAGQPNYTGHSGDHFYYRTFSHTGSGKSNAVIRMYGITTGDLVTEGATTENTIKVSFRLPDNGTSNGTAYADAVAAFNAGDPTPLQTDGEGANDEALRTSGAASGSGCHSSCTGSFVDMPVTFGGASTANTGSRLNLRVTFEDTNAPRPTQKITCIELHDKNGTGATQGACWQ